MKKCPWCGKEYQDHVSVCVLDQHPLGSSNSAPVAPAGEPEPVFSMKLILSSPVPGEIPQLRAMLESAGIACTVRNDISAGLSPEIPLSESTPELWIQDGRRLAEALEIKQAWQTAPIGGSDWICSACGETSEPQFTSCWKCGTVRPEPGLVKWIHREQAAPPPAKEEVVEEVEGGTPCVACEKLIAVDSKLCPFCGWTQP